MATVIELLNRKIASRHLLNHPFYVAWSKGELSISDLRHYAQQYFAHVRAFPTYLSEMHCRCEDLDTRRIVAGNLADEEARSPTHPELWLDFAVGLGLSREAVLRARAGAKVQALIDTFHTVARMDTGLAAAGLYCYEKQIPDVASAKIAGLEKNYSIEDEATLRYFAVHRTADEEHASQWESVLSKHAPEPGAVAKVADTILDALWNTLTEIYEGCGSSSATRASLSTT
jgi:pyrroloquinoline-quinone synthase